MYHIIHTHSGMGDVVTMVEKAQKVVDEKEVLRLLALLVQKYKYSHLRIYVRLSAWQRKWCLTLTTSTTSSRRCLCMCVCVCVCICVCVCLKICTYV